MYFTKKGACQWLDQTYHCTLDTDAMNLLESYCDTWIEYMNNIVIQSSIASLTFVKAHVAIDETYDEEVHSPDWPGTEWVLKHLTYSQYGFMDNARSLRDEYSADLIVGFMYYPDGARGRGWVPTTFPLKNFGVSITGGPYPLVSALIL